MSDKTERRKSDRRVAQLPLAGPDRRRGDRRAVVQALDARVLMSVSTDANGWTSVSPAGDTRVVYVSSSGGNDANSGFSANAPVKSLSKAQSIIRDGSADWLLLKRGDTFGAIGDWKKRGRSADQPILISAYGSGARPKIYSGVNVGFATVQKNGVNVENLVLSSLDFWAHTYNHTNGHGGTAGIRLTSPGKNILIEDVRVTGYKDNIVLDAFGGTLSNVTIRRSTVIDAHAGAGVGNGHAQGIYIGPRSANVTVEENIIDHNGWRQGINSDRTYFNHNIYAKEGATGVVIRNNVISQASFYGVKLNAGGVVSGNFFVRNAESVYLEAGATIEDNVITESVDMPSLNWGVGINTQKASKAIIRRNLITNSLSGTGGPKSAIQLFDNNMTFSGTIERNIVYNWATGLSVDSAGGGTVTIRNNQFQVGNNNTAADHRSDAPISGFDYANNIYSAGSQSNVNKVEGARKSLGQWSSAVDETNARYESVDYPDPDRNTARYATAAELGNSFANFINSARGTNREGITSVFSATTINAWFRAGFTGIGSVATVDEGPGVRGFSFDDSTAPRAVYVRFTQNVRPSLSKTDLRVINSETGERVEIASMTWSAEKRQARFNIRTADLPPGLYHAVIGAGKVENANGTPLAASRGFEFGVTEVSARTSAVASSRFPQFMSAESWRDTDLLA